MNWSTKNPPSKSGNYIVTIETQFNTRQVRQAVRYQHGDKWFWNVLPSGGGDVIAWFKQPEPFDEKL